MSKFKEFKDLKEWKRKALYMHIFEAMTGAEIARELKVPERTVQDNLKKLKGQYKHNDIRYSQEIKKNTFQHGAKILFGDIETSFGSALHFNQWGVNLGVKHSIIESH